LFARCPPVHSVLLGRSTVALDGRVQRQTVLALPANTLHTVLALPDPEACVAYLDARRYRFEDAAWLAQRWRGFQPGRDDVRELFGDALRRPQRRVDRRLLAALEALDDPRTDVASAAHGVALSESRLTHLMTDTLGAPPRSWRAWLRLRHALADVMFAGRTLTQAAHGAGFTDSAHLTRTCKRLTGVAPAGVMPRAVFASPQT
jgi:AraC-like DNA-binding protein